MIGKKGVLTEKASSNQSKRAMLLRREELQSFTGHLMSSRKKSGLTHWLPSEADSEVELASRRVGRECSWNQQLGREWKKKERDWDPASPNCHW